MKRILFIIGLLYSVSLNVAVAQCLEYEPNVVNLSGTLIRETYPGPPDFENVSKGDEPETIWVLQLKDAVCVFASDEINVREDGVKEVQLILKPEQYRQYRNLLGQQVQVTGTLFRSHTGHHYKPLLLKTSDISREAAAGSMQVHGRLSVYNGNPSCRIWIVGTKRILGIHEFEEGCPIPAELQQVLDEDIDNRLIYADFVVQPLTERKDDVMQMVRFESAENIVVTTRDRQFLRKIDRVIEFKNSE
ncbi:MAG: DUF4431 domain-containing protein [Acidobacteria bacterium]|nr:DUF4431 domain-containing protein [Acidobacteriota bacterium]